MNNCHIFRYCLTNHRPILPARVRLAECNYAKNLDIDLKQPPHGNCFNKFLRFANDK